MGNYTINKVEVIREYDPREIIVVWHDQISGKGEKRFPFDDANKAAIFAIEKFKSLSM